MTKELELIHMSSEAEEKSLKNTMNAIIKTKI